MFVEEVDVVFVDVFGDIFVDLVRRLFFNYVEGSLVVFGFGIG